MNGRNLAASVRARLLNRARETRQDFNLILTRYALERLLYRLSISPHADQFLLKGALLFDLWFDVPHRPTRDADFLGLGLAELPRDTQKQTQWQAFLGKNRLEALELEVLVAALRDFLLPPVAAANADIYFPQLWPAGGPWAPAAS